MDVREVKPMLIMVLSPAHMTTVKTICFKQMRNLLIVFFFHERLCELVKKEYHYLGGNKGVRTH